MEEALISVAFLVVAVIIGSFFKPTEAQLRPLYPDQIKAPGAAHAEESGHHHH
jgi:hypothetical protein